MSKLSASDKGYLAFGVGALLLFMLWTTIAYITVHFIEKFL